MSVPSARGSAPAPATGRCIEDTMSDEYLGANDTEAALICVLNSLMEEPLLHAYVAAFDVPEQPVVWLAYGSYFILVLVHGMALRRRLPHAKMPSNAMFVWLAGNAWYDEVTCNRLLATTVKNFDTTALPSARAAAISHSGRVTRNMAQAGYRDVAGRAVGAGTVAALDQWLLEVCEAIMQIAGDVITTPTV